MRFFSYWMLPVVSGIVWLGMLLSMLLYWIVHTDREIYPSMKNGQRIAYISDVGAFDLKPLFIAGCCVVTVFFDLGFLADKVLRHKGRLAPKTSLSQKILEVLNIFFAIVGTVGLICLSIFDTYRHTSLHRLFLLFFMGGYLISAIFICWEYQRLGHSYRDQRVLHISFWIKLAFILVEVCLAVAFGVCMYKEISDVAAILEWIVAFIFSFYIFSYVVDLYPATLTKSRSRRFTKPGMPDERAIGNSHELNEGPNASVFPGNEYPRYMERQPGRNF